MVKLFFCQNDPLMGKSFWQNNSLLTHILFELCLFMIFSPVANLMHHPILYKNFSNLIKVRENVHGQSLNQIYENCNTKIGASTTVAPSPKSDGVTVVCKIVHKFASVWCKTALGEVGVSLPWWCAALVLLAPGYWSLFLNLKNLFIMEKWPLVIFP